LAVFCFGPGGYSLAMNSLQKLSTDLTRSRGMAVIQTPDRARGVCTELIATLILKGPLFVVAGSEWLPAYDLTRLIRRNTLEVKQTLNRMYSARTSTCYRLFDSLANLPSTGEPILILDFLHTLYDDDIPLPVRSFKLRQCCQELKRLAFYRSVIVMIQQMPVEEHETFLSLIHPLTNHIITLEPEHEIIQQPALF
jgi:hypothetical protein